MLTQAAPNLFLLYITDLLNSILRSFVDIYTDNPTVHDCTSKSVHDHVLVADLDSDLAQTAHWRKK